MSRYMLIMRTGPEAEALMAEQEIDFDEIIESMGRFNEELIKAGVMLAGEGLHPSSKGVRIEFGGEQPKVVDGPFAETKELIAGFWIMEVDSLEDAVEWIKRCPNPDGVHGEIEIRQVFEAEDFGEEFTPELREQQERLRAEYEDDPK